MTKPLSLPQKVANLKARIDRACHTVTLVELVLDENFREVVLAGDGFLQVKAVFNAKGNRLKVMKCPGWEHHGYLLLDTPNITMAEDVVVVSDHYNCISNNISFQKFEAICMKYKKRWKLPSLSELQV